MKINYGVFDEKEGAVVAWHEDSTRKGNYVLSICTPFGRIIEGVEKELSIEQAKQLIDEVEKDEIGNEVINYATEITEALSDVPNEVALIALTDINQRISDWLASGGAPDAPYIQQQINYAKGISTRFGTKKEPLTAGKQSQ